VTALTARATSQPSGSRWLSGLLLLAYALGYYIYADLPLGGSLRLPAAGAILGGLGLLALHMGRLRHGDIAFAGAAVGVTLATILLNPAFYESSDIRQFAGDYATSYIVFLASLPMAVGVIAALRDQSAPTLAKSSLTALMLLLLGVAAERFAGFGVLSDAVRASLFPPEIVYAEDLRDQLIYGAVRPKLFTSEPSHVSKAFMLALLIWYVTAEGRARIPAFYVLLAVGAVLIRSPGVLAVLPAAWIAELCRMQRSRWILLALPAGLLLAPLAWFVAEAAFAERIAHIASGQDGSFLIRVVLPFEVLLGVWSEHPLFGLGFGAKESGIPYALSAAQGMQLDVEALLGTNAPLGNNGVFIGLIQLGPLGSLLFALVFAVFWRFACGRYALFAAAATLGYLTLIGGINDPRFWGGFALITAAGAAARTRDAGARRPLPAARA
jgi:hypothetical protein